MFSNQLRLVLFTFILEQSLVFEKLLKTDFYSDPKHFDNILRVKDSETFKMGILKLDIKQHVGKKKSLPKKRKQTENATDNFCNAILDISMEENLWVTGVEKQVTLSTPEPFTEEEDCFKSIWDINIMVSEDSAPPSEAHILAENNDLS